MCHAQCRLFRRDGEDARADKALTGPNDVSFCVLWGRPGSAIHHLKWTVTS